MRQYLKHNKEMIVIVIAVVLAMLFQYFRVANLNVAFLLETDAPTSVIYLLVIGLIPVVVLFFVFVPLLFIVEVAYSIKVPFTIHIEITEVVYSIKSKVCTYIVSSRSTTVLRC